MDIIFPGKHLLHFATGRLLNSSGVPLFLPFPLKELEPVQSSSNYSNYKPPRSLALRDCRAPFPFFKFSLLLGPSYFLPAKSLHFLNFKTLFPICFVKDYDFKRFVAEQRLKVLGNIGSGPIMASEPFLISSGIRKLPNYILTPSLKNLEPLFFYYYLYLSKNGAPSLLQRTMPWII